MSIAKLELFGLVFALSCEQFVVEWVVRGQNDRQWSGSIVRAAEFQVRDDVSQQVPSTDTFAHHITVVRQVGEVHVEVVVRWQVMHERSDQSWIDAPHCLNGGQ